MQQFSLMEHIERSILSLNDFPHISFHRDSKLYHLPDFLTVCEPVDYTNKFDTCRLGGLTAALCLQEEPAAMRVLCGCATKGGLLCQSAHINRGNDAAQKRTDSARA